jgi:hypothetical protein
VYSLRVSFLQAQLRERRKLEVRKHTIANAEAALAAARATVASARTELSLLEVAREAEREAEREAAIRHKRRANVTKARNTRRLKIAKRKARARAMAEGRARCAAERRELRDQAQLLCLLATGTGSAIEPTSPTSSIASAHATTTTPTTSDDETSPLE